MHYYPPSKNIVGDASPHSSPPPGCTPMQSGKQRFQNFNLILLCTPGAEPLLPIRFNRFGDLSPAVGAARTN